MKLFEQHEILQALEHARWGGQALHVWKGNWPGGREPGCFLKGEPWARLFDNDQKRLVETAKSLGVRCVKVHGRKNRMHVDLCGGPLRRAVEESEEGKKS